MIRSIKKIPLHGLANAGGAPMGLTHVTVKVSNLTKKGKSFHADFLVDTGSMDSLAPRPKLEAAGVQVEGKQVYELASGDKVEYEYGFARLTILGDQTVARIIFGPAHAEPLLGVLALEGVGVVVDPLTQTLKRLNAIPLK
jgi:clan AA aspartic protease